ncbi:MAG: 3-phosphoglycerate dehydrogenase family protein [Planctomycetota bacterium]
MHVLIADKFETRAMDELKQSGCQIMYEPKLEGDSLRETVLKTRCAVLVVRSTKVSEAILEAGPELGLVVRAGAGFNTIDVDAASRRSIFVSNCPGKNAVAVAELTFALILALDRRIVENSNDLRAGRWNKQEYSKARGLKGRTLGIVGLGQIGRAVAVRAQAFDMNVVAWSRSLTVETAGALGVTRCDTPSEVAGRCDILSIHLAAGPETKSLINAEVLNRLAPGSYVINTSRAEVLDYAALLQVMEQKKLRVGLDVFPDEPAGGHATFTPAILQSGGVTYGTHHIGASTDQAQDAIAAETVRIVRTYRETGQVLNCVNVRAHARAQSCLRVRHLNRPGVLAYVLNEISHAGINVEEMQNVICQGDASACAQILLEQPLPSHVIPKIRSGNSNILGVTQTLHT